MEFKTLSHIVNFLVTVPFFSEVSPQALTHLCESLKVKKLKKGSVVFQKDEEGDSMFVILDGKVQVHENDHIFGQLEKGDCFGEYALIDSKSRSATVTTIESCELLQIDKDHFHSLMRTDQGFARGMLAVLIKRHRELDEMQERLATSRHELSEANTKMSGLINGAMDSIIMFDSKFRIILTNPSAHTILENDDVLQRNVLFFLDEVSAEYLEKMIVENQPKSFNSYLPIHIKVIGSQEGQSTHEGTISKYGPDHDPFYTLILRDLKERLDAEDTIQHLRSQTNYLKEEIRELTSSYGILAKDAGMKKVIEAINQVAATQATVLITGETGTGKELVARAIHMASNRNDKPLIRINCGAIPANLIESELFGHEKGAFTGATTSRKGRFLLADQGTIFLDEIGELPLELQPKLLRVIQEGEFDPVGSSETIKVDVRILAATHRDLLRHTRENKFREDLYYRLNVFPIDVPALRHRGDDVCHIAREMLSEFSKKLNKMQPQLTETDESLFRSYPWPGNVRELQNLVERAVIIASDGQVNWSNLIPQSAQEPTDEIKRNVAHRIYTAEQMTTLEKENIIKALKMANWKVSGKNGAASILHLPPTTLASRIKALHIKRPS